MKNAIWISAICMAFILGFLVGAKAISNSRALNQTIITKIENVFRDSEPEIKYVDRIVEVPVIKYVASGQRKPSLGEVTLFIREDDTDKLTTPIESALAITFQERAHERGIRCAVVRLDCTNSTGDDTQHFINAFDTEEDGMVFVCAKFDYVARNVSVGGDYGYLVSIAEGKSAKDSGIKISHMTYEW